MNIIIETIQMIVKRYLNNQSFNAMVLEVDKNKYTCKVKPDDGPELFGVRIASVEDYLGKKILVFPKINSYVMVSLIENNPAEAYISKTGEIDEILVDCDSVIINGGEYGGLVKVQDLVTRLNNVEQRINDLQTTLKTHTHPYINVSTPSNTSVSTDFVTYIDLQKTTKNQIENTKIKHG